MKCQGIKLCERTNVVSVMVGEALKSLGPRFVGLSEGCCSVSGRV